MHRKTKKEFWCPGATVSGSNETWHTTSYARLFACMSYQAKWWQWLHTTYLALAKSKRGDGVIIIAQPSLPAIDLPAQQKVIFIIHWLEMSMRWPIKAERHPEATSLFHPFLKWIKAKLLQREQYFNQDSWVGHPDSVGFEVVFSILVYFREGSNKYHIANLICP